MKKMIVLLLVLVVVVAGVGCGGDSAETSQPLLEPPSSSAPAPSEPESPLPPAKLPSDTVEEYLALLIAGDLEESQKHLNEKFLYDEDRYLNLENFLLFIAKSQFTVLEESINNDEAKVTVSYSRPNTLDLESQLLRSSGISGASTLDIRRDSYYYDRLISADYKTETGNIQITLEKTSDTWIIVKDFYFSMLVSPSPNESYISNNELKKEERAQYITENVELLDFAVAYYEKFSGYSVPALFNVAVKNNGEKTITKVVIVVDFKDDNGTSVLQRHVAVIGSTGRRYDLRKGYSWKSGEGEYYELKGLPEGISVDKCDVSIFDVEFSTITENGTTAEDDYIANYLQITNGTVDICESYDWRGPGLENVAFKNTGERSIDEITVTVYFIDDSGNYNAEYSVLVYGGWLSGTGDLKPNYSWKMKDREFYKIENLTEDVNIKNYEIKITKISFAD